MGKALRYFYVGVNTIKRHFTVNSYIGTYVCAIMSMLAMIVLTGLFSRFWPNDEFLEFAKLQRYMGFIVALSSFSLGFSIMAKSSDFSLSEQIYPVAFWSVCVTSTGLGVSWLLYSSEHSYLGLWIVAVALFHIYISSIRFQEPAEANRVTIKLKVVLLLVIALFCAFATKSPLDYFFIYGGALLAYIVWDSLDRGYTLNPFKFSSRIAITLYVHGFSRAIDNVTRLSFHVAPVWCAEHLWGNRAAGLIALSLLATKAVESSLQSVVLHIHSQRVRNICSNNLPAIFKLTMLAVFLTVAGYLFLYMFGTFVIGLWITDNYVGILEFVKIVIWTIPCAIMLQLLKGEMESRTKVSPFVYLNLLSVLLMIAVALYYASSIKMMVWIYVIFFWLRSLASVVYVVNFNNKIAG